jgi:hypothetical protein
VPPDRVSTLCNKQKTPCRDVMCVYAQFQNPKMRESLKCKSVLSRFLDPASMSSYMLAARRGYICIEMYEGSGVSPDLTSAVRMMRYDVASKKIPRRTGLCQKGQETPRDVCVQEDRIPACL